MRLVPVPAGEVGEWLPRIGWHLASFCEGGQWEPGDLIRDVRSRDRQLWIAEDGGEVRAVCLTAISGDRLKSVLVTHCAGEGFALWAHFIEAIAAWGREIGAKRIEVTARPGWERILKPYGLRKTHVTLERRL